MAVLTGKEFAYINGSTVSPNYWLHRARSRAARLDGCSEWHVDVTQYTSSGVVINSEETTISAPGHPVNFDFFMVKLRDMARDMWRERDNHIYTQSLTIQEPISTKYFLPAKFVREDVVSFFAFCQAVNQIDQELLKRAGAGGKIERNLFYSYYHDMFYGQDPDDIFALKYNPVTESGKFELKLLCYCVQIN